MLADKLNTNSIHQALSVIHPETGKVCQYKDLIQDPKTCNLWLEAMCRELSRLADGWNDIEGTQTIRFMNHDEIKNIPRDRTITYA